MFLLCLCVVVFFLLMFDFDALSRLFRRSFDARSSSSFVCVFVFYLIFLLFVCVLCYYLYYFYFFCFVCLML